MGTIAYELATAISVRRCFKDEVIGDFGERFRMTCGRMVTGQVSQQEFAALSDYVGDSHNRLTGVLLHFAKYATPDQEIWRNSVGKLTMVLESLYCNQPAAAPFFAECAIGFLGPEAPEARQQIAIRAAVCEQAEALIARARKPHPISLDNL